MNVYLIPKKKGRLCTTQIAADAAMEYEGISGLTLKHCESGRPVLYTQEGPSSVNISVSDTKNCFFICFSDKNVGIDAEERSRRISSSVVKALHPLEQKYLSGLDQQSREWKEEFLRIWTGKESYMKYCGRGLSMGASGFSVINEELEYSLFIQKEKFPKAFLTYSDCSANNAVSVCLDPDYCGEELNFVRLEADFPPAVGIGEAAADLLDTRAYGSRELEKKLTSKGYSAQDARKTAEIMRERGYIDDEGYAESIARRSFGEGKGILAVKRDLLARGIDAAAASEICEDLTKSDFSQEDSALKIAEKMIGKPSFDEDFDDFSKVDDKMKAKIARKLASRGFEASVIARVLEKIVR